MRSLGVLPDEAKKASRTLEVDLGAVEELLRAFEWESPREGVWRHPTLGNQSCPVEMAFALTMRTLINDATGVEPHAEA